MLSEKEQQFVHYWEQNRGPESGFLSKLSRGLPMAIVFGLPILLSVVVVFIFYPDWYAKISNVTAGSFPVILVAVIIAVLFFSYFRMHFKWEMNEQLYRELKSKEHRNKAANT